MMKRSSTIRIYTVITLLVGLWCAGILAVPLLHHAGFHGGADIVSSIYSRICHQNDVHSFHMDGEKFGVCIRCSAIYFGFLAGLLFMPLSGALRHIRIPNHKIMIAVMIPMLLDVMLNDTGLLISTTVTRVATGILFGGVMPWYLVPLFIEATLQLRQKKKIQSLDSGVGEYVRKTQ
jgi:uncharacterized membrane protein